MALTKYVAGLLFRDDEVALIRKNRPDWQAGKLNAVGGKVEPSEYPVYAMRREFAEEAGYQPPLTDWRQFCTLEHPHRGGEVHFFTAMWDQGIGPITKNMTDEPVDWYKVRDVLAPSYQLIIPNLRWLIPLALNPSQEMVRAMDSSTL